MRVKQKYQYIGGILCIGVFGGTIGVLFHTLLSYVVQGLYGGDVIASLSEMPLWLVLLLPAVGGLVTGLLIHGTRTPEVYGEGVPAIHRALDDQAGLIRYRVLFVKMFATIATIGTGGSAGREGPVIQMGGALGSMVAQVTKQPLFERETFLLAGAAAAMAATFGTPAAAIVFVAEVLRRKMTIVRAFVVVSAVIIARIVSVSIFGYHGLVLGSVGEVSLSFTLFCMSVGVGVIAGLVAVTFGMSLRYARSSFVRLPVAAWLRPAFGGLIVGGLLIFLPRLHESAFYQFNLEAFTGMELPMQLILMLVIAKIIATSVTVGSGGSGGIFAPSLFLGLLVGMFGNSVITMFGFSASPVLLAVGMTALFAGAAHAPITAVFLLYEVIDTTTILPYLIAGAGAGYLTARLISSAHMYTRDNL